MCLYSYPQILYVDDADTCEMVTLLLQQEEDSYEVTTASSTEEALEIISKRSFDLYIFDNPWREPSGLELCRHIRQKDGKTPIMIFSVMPHDTDRDTAIAAGANAYLVKPTDLHRFTGTIEQLLNDGPSGLSAMS